MNIRHFQPGMPGRLEPISGGEQAFVPDPLPPSWQFPARLWPMLAEAKLAIGILEGIGRVLPNPSILLRPIENREAIQSSALEGTYATPRELLLYELESHDVETETDATNRYREVYNYRRAIYREVYNYRRAIDHGAASTLPICLRLMRELHELLLDGVRGQDKAPGKFRQTQVAIGSNHRFIPPPPQFVDPCLNALEAFIHAGSPYNSLVECFLVHYQFETIHPFLDGNGRIGRLLLALMLQRNCQMTRPWLYLSDYFEQHKDEYIQGLYQVSTQAHWERWVEFCLHATIAQTRATISRCERLLAIRQQYQAKLQETGGHIRLQAIIELLFDSPFVRVIDVAKRLSVTYPTAKADLEKLTAAGILHPLEGPDVKTYLAQAVYGVAYENISDNLRRANQEE